MPEKQFIMDLAKLLIAAAWLTIPDEDREVL